MRAPAPQTFGGMLLLNGIDKLIFTALLGLIAWSWTSRQERHDRNLMRAEKISSIEIQRPVSLVEELSEPVRQCILFIRSKSVQGITSPKDKAKLQSFTLDIQLLLDLIDMYAKEAKTDKSAGNLRKLVGTFNIKVAAAGVEHQDYVDFTDKLREGFVEMSSLVIKETTDRILKKGTTEGFGFSELLESVGGVKLPSRDP